MIMMVGGGCDNDNDDDFLKKKESPAYGNINDNFVDDVDDV